MRARAGRDLVGRRVGDRAGFSDKNVAQDLGDLLRIAVFQAIGSQRVATGIGPVQPLHPEGDALQQLGALGHHHDGIHARYGLELDDALALPIFTGLEYSLELKSWSPARSTSGIDAAD